MADRAPEAKLSKSLDELIAQASKKRDRKPQAPRQPAGQAPKAGPRKGLNKNRQNNNQKANGAPQQRPPKQPQQQVQVQQVVQQQPQQHQRPRHRRGSGGGGAANLGVRGGQVQKRSVIEVPARVLRAPLQVAPAVPQRPKMQQQQQQLQQLRQPAPEGKWKHDLYNDYPPPRRAPVSQAPPASAKLIIKNLFHGVSADDLLELFSTCGTVKSHGVNYDTSGRSLGTGWVVFETRAESEVAKREYHGVKLDGQPMHIYFSDELAVVPVKKLSSGIVVQKPGTGGGGGSAGAGGSDRPAPGSGGQRLAAAAIRETAAASRRAGGRGGNPRGGRLRSAVVGRASLDKELQDYMQE